MTVTWVDCPICGESDMRCETDSEGASLISCVNSGCESNIVKNNPPVAIQSPLEMWEILVPTIRRNDNKPIKVRYHRVWDEKVRAISGGLTILTPAKGQWTSKDGELFVERMIPVRIICTEAEINKIVDMTLKYYDQLAVLAYRVSNQVIMRHADELK